MGRGRSASRARGFELGKKTRTMKNATIWWFLGLISGSLGGLPSVSILAWFQPLCLLQFVHHADVATGPIARRIGVSALAHGAGALGYWVSHASMFNEPTWNLEGVLLVLAISVVGWAVLLLAFLSDAFFRRTYPLAANVQPLVFPLLWTAMWYLSSSLFLLGAIGNPAITQTGVRPLILTTSLFGIEGVTFIMAWSAAVAHQHLLEYRDDLATSDVAHAEVARSRHTRTWAAALFLVLLYGGLWQSVFSGAFFQQDLPDVIKPTAPVSCVLGNMTEGMQLAGLLNSTAARLTAGDEIVLWSEAAGYVRGDLQEEELLLRAQILVTQSALSSPRKREDRGSPRIAGETIGEVRKDGQSGRERREKRRGRKFLRRSSGREEEGIMEGKAWEWWRLPWLGNSGRANQKSKSLLREREQEGGLGSEPLIGGGPYVGLAYQKLLDGHQEGAPGSASNKLVLVGPKGIAFAYEKRHPVFFVERDVVPGKGQVPASVKTSSGFTVGGAICYDFDFPGFIRGAARDRVDLMLQPAMAWGSVGAYDVNSNAIRAVENGFTLFRCSSIGVSAIVSPTLQYYAYQEALTEGVLTFRLPIARHAWTPYPIFGFLLGPFVLALAVLLCLLAWVPSEMVRRLLSYTPVWVATVLIGEDPRIEQTFDTSTAESTGIGWWCWGNGVVEPPRQNQGLLEGLVDNYTLGVIEASSLREPILAQRGSRSY